MSATDPDVFALRTVTHKLVESVISIEASQWTMATPCGDWDLRALVDHITGGNWFTVAVLTGERAEDAMAATVAKFDDRSMSDDAVMRSLRDQVAAFLRPQTLDRTWDHVAGELGGRQILRLRLHDLIVHSWDIDETLRPGSALPHDLARWGIEDLAHDASLVARHFELADRPRVGSPDAGSTFYLEVFGRGPRTSL